jgi:hypothetical protein
MNISQSEFTTKYKLYLQQLNNKAKQEAEADLLQSHLSDVRNRPKRSIDDNTAHPSTDLTYSNHSFEEYHELVVENRELISISHTRKYLY